MAVLSISAAARATGIHRVTIQKHIKSGKLSVSRDAVGKPVVDVAELIRVYGPLKSDGSTDSSSQVQPKQQEATSSETALVALVKQLEAAHEREEWLKRQLEAEQERSRELERRLLPPGDSSREESSPVASANPPQGAKSGDWEKWLFWGVIVALVLAVAVLFFRKILPGLAQG